MSSKPEIKIVELPTDLYTKIEKYLKASSDFASVESFVVFVLNEVLSNSPEQQSAFTKEEEKEIKQTLKALGHFDP